MIRTMVAGAFALTSLSAAQAQTVFHWPAPINVSANEGQRFYLPMGTALMLRTRTQISTKDNKPGDRVYLEVAETVSFRGHIVIPIGSPVIAEVSRVQRNGHFGRKGKLEIRLLQAETPSGPVRLTGMASDEGKSGTAASVGTMLFVSGLGFLIHGTSGEIMPGTPVRAYLAEPLWFRWYPRSPSTDISFAQAQPDSAASLAQPGFPTLEAGPDR
ncbi:hypothetical protein [Caenibius sp. WL]|uniref:hypothetical protein n=1 Tax=Caenibius sp. WL TaxID=2872646 RepID=UPI001C98F123|nr:hypothetical protein [Caenibius sp. WL]QZP07727.1 hypothetical protein K5X80_13890 [Caenibius sp. WL]